MEAALYLSRTIGDVPPYEMMMMMMMMMTIIIIMKEQFSVECRKLSVALLRSVIGLKNSRQPPSRPIRCKTKTNRYLVTRVFPRLRLVTCNYFEF